MLWYSPKISGDITLGEDSYNFQICLNLSSNINTVTSFSRSLSTNFNRFSNNPTQPHLLFISICGNRQNITQRDLCVWHAELGQLQKFQFSLLARKPIFRDVFFINLHSITPVMGVLINSFQAQATVFYSCLSIYLLRQ